MIYLADMYVELKAAKHNAKQAREIGEMVYCVCCEYGCAGSIGFGRRYFAIRLWWRKNTPSNEPREKVLTQIRCSRVYANFFGCWRIVRVRKWTHADVGETGITIYVRPRATD